MGYTPQVDPLDYNFAPHAEISGITPEPEPEQIKAYLNGSQNMWRRHSEDLAKWSDRRKVLGLEPSIEELERFNTEYEAWQDESATKRLETRRKLLAMLCSNQPSEEDLATLPGRIFDDFENYMQDALTPKERSSATS